MICKICNKECKSSAALGKHIHKMHDISSQDYYNKYYKNSNEGICPICNKLTPFMSLSKGYQKYCSSSCAQQSENNIFKTNNPSYYNKNKSYNIKQIDFVCNICKKECYTSRAAVNHIRKHKISGRDYWLQYQSGKCKVCNKETKYISIDKGFDIYCSKKCKCLDLYNSTTDIHKYDNRRKHLNELRTNYENTHDVMRYSDVIDKYGQGWLSIKNQIPMIIYAGVKYIELQYLDMISNYKNIPHYKHPKKENELVEYIQTFYIGEILINSRKVIYPKELDIYLPELNLAIEYNGTYWHSDISSFSKDYHLNKSILCREKNIRLIHIYEFEDFNKQKQLIKDLILGQDNYPIGDFNKNNLIDNIPKPIIIYSDNRLNVYGAGNLL